jgi:hypothetical protein
VPDILTLQTPHFVLSVWTKETAKPQALLEKTHATRGASLPASSLRFNPALAVASVTPPSAGSLTELPVGELVLPEVLFFENKLYEFEFVFDDSVNPNVKPAIIHRLSSVEESFHCKQRSLRGSINFGNDIGWFRLGIRYRLAGRDVEQYLSFEVQPTKMAMAGDLEAIHKKVDSLYPLWHFSFAQKTEQELAKSRKPHERFELLWLAHFEKLRADLQKGIQRICNAPHTRLMPYEHHVRAERLHGRLSPKLEERITAHLRNGESHHHYRVNGKRLSLDTPENRFVKMVLTKCGQDIARFKERAMQANISPESGRLSESFFAELDSWKRPLDQLLNRPLFDEVGDFEGMAAESLVLHQRAGYAGVYRIWQELKLYLDVFGRNASVSMKSVAELYEVWCLLEVRQILLDLGFKEKASTKATLVTQGLEKKLDGGMGAAFQLERDGIKIRLAHEPIFSRTKDPAFGKIYSWTTVQKPDIFLEATFANGESVQWIFDAKYRIAEDKDGRDCAPDDAINQMHRYRDALIHVNKADDGGQEKTRPILGAYVLYPGWHDETGTSNTYDEAIGAVGIGGFPLLPGRPNKWLRDFLTGRFGNANMIYVIREPDQYLAEDSARIATTGTYLGRYKDLTLATSLGPDRSETYVERYRQGTAGWYHMPVTTPDNNSVERNVMREVRYLTAGVYYSDKKGRFISHLYEVKSVRLVKRREISAEQAGKASSSRDEYWLFELGYAQPLDSQIEMSIRRGKFPCELVQAADLLKAKDWKAVTKRYALLT